MMKVHWTYFACSKTDEEQLQRHWEDGLRHLQSYSRKIFLPQRDPRTHANRR
jgi:hypothetical protein